MCQVESTNDCILVTLLHKNAKNGLELPKWENQNKTSFSEGKL